MFTDRFIKVPVELYDTKEADIIGYSKDTKFADTYMKINPFEISHYRPSTDNNDALSETCVHFKNGSQAVIKMTTEKFEELLNKFNQ